jgi:ribosomal protein L40E
MDVGEYLLSLNLPFALLVGGVLVVVGLVLLRFLMATTSEVGRMVPGAGEAAGRAILDARDMPENSWICTTCRSVNTPQAEHCYRGCGSREELGEPLPKDRSQLADRQNGKRIL